MILKEILERYREFTVDDIYEDKIVISRTITRKKEKEVQHLQPWEKQPAYFEYHGAQQFTISKLKEK